MEPALHLNYLNNCLCWSYRRCVGSKTYDPSSDVRSLTNLVSGAVPLDDDYHRFIMQQTVPKALKALMGRRNLEDDFEDDPSDVCVNHECFVSRFQGRLMIFFSVFFATSAQSRRCCGYKSKEIQL